MADTRRDVIMDTLHGVRLFFSGREKKSYTADEIVELIDRIAMGKELDENGFTYYEAAELLRRIEDVKAGRNIVVQEFDSIEDFERFFATS